MAAAGAAASQTKTTQITVEMMVKNERPFFSLMFISSFL
jgi:hypothetical protein